jgi:hypothetical protein
MLCGWRSSTDDGTHDITLRSTDLVVIMAIVSINDTAMSDLLLLFAPSGAQGQAPLHQRTAMHLRHIDHRLRGAWMNGSPSDMHPLITLHDAFAFAPGPWTGVPFLPDHDPAGPTDGASFNTSHARARLHDLKRRRPHDAAFPCKERIVS